MPEVDWNAQLYRDKHSFVFQYGEDVLSWLKPEPGETILDVGCGTGELTYQISKAEANVTGIDASEQMIQKAKEKYPSVPFFVKDATTFSFDKKFDAAFSNATLHWINNQVAALQCIYNCLKPKGRFVFEMGGRHNIESIETALKQTMKEEGLEKFLPASSYYFPSVAKQSALLEETGFTVSNVACFKRPTQLTGEDGMKNWLAQFGSFYFKQLTEEQKSIIINKTVESLKATNYADGTWTADYVRLRCKAIKE